MPHAEESYVQKILSSDKAFYLFETITPPMLHILESIKQIAEGESLFSELLIHSKSVELLTLFFKKIEKRSSVKAISNLNINDVETVFRVRKIILENLSNIPNIPDLAQNASMSTSKLQKCFKQIIGKPIAEYVLHEKMEWAKRLLSSKRYTVAEVGYEVGYTNLSHFTEAFRKHHKINPKKYLSSL